MHVPRSSTPRSPLQEWPVQISHGGSQGFKSPHLTPIVGGQSADRMMLRRRSRRRRGHLGATLGPRPDLRGSRIMAPSGAGLSLTEVVLTPRNPRVIATSSDLHT